MPLNLVNPVMESLGQEDHFSYDNEHGFCVTVPDGGLKYAKIPRATIAELKTYLFPTVKLTRGGNLCERQPPLPVLPGYPYFLGQLLHFRLNCNFQGREEACAILKQGLMAGTLKVPQDLQELERRLRRAARRRAKKIRKADASSVGRASVDAKKEEGPATWDSEDQKDAPTSSAHEDQSDQAPNETDSTAANSSSESDEEDQIESYDSLDNEAHAVGASRSVHQEGATQPHGLISSFEHKLEPSKKEADLPTSTHTSSAEARNASHPSSELDGLRVANETSLGPPKRRHRHSLQAPPRFDISHFSRRPGPTPRLERDPNNPFLDVPRSQMASPRSRILGAGKSFRAGPMALEKSVTQNGSEANILAQAGRKQTIPGVAALQQLTSTSPRSYRTVLQSSDQKEKRIHFEDRHEAHDTHSSGIVSGWPSKKRKLPKFEEGPEMGRLERNRGDGSPATRSFRSTKPQIGQVNRGDVGEISISTSSKGHKAGSSGKIKTEPGKNRVVGTEAMRREPSSGFESLHLKAEEEIDTHGSTSARREGVQRQKQRMIGLSRQSGGGLHTKVRSNHPLFHGTF